ncbi:hypothetical protein D9M71_791870 [compost metagenome]
MVWEELIGHARLFGPAQKAIREGFDATSRASKEQSVVAAKNGEGVVRNLVERFVSAINLQVVARGGALGGFDIAPDLQPEFRRGALDLNDFHRRR